MPGLLWDYFDKSINWYLLFATKEYSTSYKQICSMDRNFHPNVELFVTFWWRLRLTVQMISEWKLYGYGPDTVDFLYLYTSATVRTYKSVHYIRIGYGYRMRYMRIPWILHCCTRLLPWGCAKSVHWPARCTFNKASSPDNLVPFFSSVLRIRILK